YPKTIESTYSKMRDRYRGRTGIISQILEATDEQEGIGKTHLIYNAFLSHDPLEEYVKLLAESGLLCYDSITGTSPLKEVLSFLIFTRKWTN
ncbi:MAG: winged helix-turn-helix domain-containing protein, partial [Nitrososphaera sp.]